MRRHDLDWTSLLAGLVVTALGLAYLVGAYTDVRLDGRWVLPTALIGLGVAGLAGGIAAARRDRTDDGSIGTPSAATDGIEPAGTPADLTSGSVID